MRRDVPGASLCSATEESRLNDRITIHGGCDDIRPRSSGASVPLCPTSCASVSLPARRWFHRRLKSRRSWFCDARGVVMKPVEVSTTIQRSPVEVFEFLDVLANHEQFTD